MKKSIVLLILTLFYGFIQAQSYTNNFEVSENKTIWRYIYTATQSDNIIGELLLLNNIETPIVTDTKITGRLKPIIPEYQSAGYTRSNTPIYISSNFVTGNVIIDIQEGRYRVTVRDILFIQNIDLPISEQGEVWQIEIWSQNNNSELKPLFLKAPATILNYTFLKLFDVSKNQNDNNW